MRPTEEAELARIIADHARREAAIEIVGNGSKQGIGRPVTAATQVVTRNFRGVTLYEPSEMVISARAGTPLSTIQNELDKHNQRLAAEPLDLGPMLGNPEGAATIGGVVMANLSGSRRILAGAVRDQVLGLRAINGRGEIFKTGGRVMKNVTGYDLCRGLSGSWGTLAVLTEVTLKVLPNTEETRTLLVLDQPDELAVELMCAAMGTPFEVSGALHLDETLAGRLAALDLIEKGRPTTALRIENASPAVAYRIAQLSARFRPHGQVVELDHAASIRFWRAIQRLQFLVGTTGPVWRISTAPSRATEVVRAIRGYSELNVAYDWSGGLIWIETPASADAGAADIRRVVATLGGHGTLIRASETVRAGVECFQPLEPGVMSLSRRLKKSFDPAGILNPGRMYVEL